MNFFNIESGITIIVMILGVTAIMLSLEKYRCQYIEIVKFMTRWYTTLCLLTVVPFLLSIFTTDIYLPITPWLLSFIFLYLRARHTNFDEEYLACQNKTNNKH